MQWIDTHAHLYGKEFAQDRQDMFARAFQAGVDKLLLPNIDASSIEGMLDLEIQYPGQCYAMMGLHPCYVKEDITAEMTWVREWLAKRPL